MGNLYRLLRALEEEGLVSSDWDGVLPRSREAPLRAHARRRALLDHWVEALRRSQERTSEFLKRYEEGR